MNGVAIAAAALHSAAQYIPSTLKTGESGRTAFANRLRDSTVSVQTTLGIYMVRGRWLPRDTLQSQLGALR